MDASATAQLSEGTTPLAAANKSSDMFEHDVSADKTGAAPAHAPDKPNDSATGSHLNADQASNGDSAPHTHSTLHPHSPDTAGNPQSMQTAQTLSPESDHDSADDEGQEEDEEEAPADEADAATLAAAQQVEELLAVHAPSARARVSILAKVAAQAPVAVPTLRSYAGNQTVDLDDSDDGSAAEPAKPDVAQLEATYGSNALLSRMSTQAPGSTQRQVLPGLQGRAALRQALTQQAALAAANSHARARGFRSAVAAGVGSARAAVSQAAKRAERARALAAARQQALAQQRLAMAQAIELNAADDADELFSTDDEGALPASSSPVGELAASPAWSAQSSSSAASEAELAGAPPAELTQVNEVAGEADSDAVHTPELAYQPAPSFSSAASGDEQLPTAVVLSGRSRAAMGSQATSTVAAPTAPATATSPPARAAPPSAAGASPAPSAHSRPKLQQLDVAAALAAAPAPKPKPTEKGTLMAMLANAKAKEVAAATAAEAAAQAEQDQAEALEQARAEARRARRAAKQAAKSGKPKNAAYLAAVQADVAAAKARQAALQEAGGLFNDEAEEGEESGEDATAGVGTLLHMVRGKAGKLAGVDEAKAEAEALGEGVDLAGELEDIVDNLSSDEDDGVDDDFMVAQRAADEARQDKAIARVIQGGARRRASAAAQVLQSLAKGADLDEDEAALAARIAAETALLGRPGAVDDDLAASDSDDFDDEDQGEVDLEAAVASIAEAHRQEALQAKRQARAARKRAAAALAKAGTKRRRGMFFRADGVAPEQLGSEQPAESAVAKPAAEVQAAGTVDTDDSDDDGCPAPAFRQVGAHAKLASTKPAPVVTSFRGMFNSDVAGSAGSHNSGVQAEAQTAHVPAPPVPTLQHEDSVLDLMLAQSRGASCSKSGFIVEETCSAWTAPLSILPPGEVSQHATLAFGWSGGASRSAAAANTGVGGNATRLSGAGAVVLGTAANSASSRCASMSGFAANQAHSTTFSRSASSGSRSKLVGLYQ